MPSSHNWSLETSWLFKKMKRPCQTYIRTKMFVEIGAIMALK